MRALCHRCQRELPERPLSGAATSPATLDDVVLFCPFCSAPQVHLPEYMRRETGDEARESATGLPPPPRPDSSLPNAVDWRQALGAGGLVALLGGLTTVLSLAVPNTFVQQFSGFLNGMLVLGGAVLAVGIYARRTPPPRLSGIVGMRIGLVTGLLMVLSRALALGATGVVARFGLHAMGGFDADLARQLLQVQEQTMTRLEGQDGSREVREKLAGMLASPEVRGGLMLVYTGILSVTVMMFSAAGGAFAGLLRTPRPGLRPSE